MNANSKTCPDCGAVLESGAETCWHCRRDFRTAERAEENPFASPAEAQLPKRTQFSIADALVFTAVVAVVLGVLITVPALGIPLAIFGAPAFIHTWVASQRRRAQGTRMPLPEKLRIFVSTMILIVVVLVTVVICFTAVCATSAGIGAAINPQGPGGAIGMVLGLVVATVVSVAALRSLCKIFFP